VVLIILVSVWAGKSHGIGEIKDADRIALRLAAFCGKLTEDAGKGS